MTSIQLNAELFRQLSIIAEDEDMMTKVLKYVKKLASKHQADATLTTQEQFFANTEKAEKQIEQGEGRTFTNANDMNAWLNAL